MQEIREAGEARMALVLEAWKLLRAIRGPVDTLFEHFERMSHTSACRALLEMGVFDTLPMDGQAWPRLN